MLNDAEIFIQVAELKSFSKAAKKLNLAPPIVTRHIAKLEKELAIRLFQRSTRHVSLTEAGKLFYEHALQLLEIYQHSVKQVKSFGKEIIGTLKIGLPHTISQLYVIPALNHFLKKYPGLRVEIVTGNHLLDLLSNGFDLIIHCGEIHDSRFHAKLLGQWSKITCASPDYLKKNKAPKTPFDLKQHRCLDHFDNIDRRWRYLIEKTPQAVPVEGCLSINSSLGLKEAALSGMGITYLPNFVVKKELASGELKPLLEKYQLPALNMYVIYPSKQYLSQKTKAFIEFLEALGLADD